MIHSPRLTLAVALLLSPRFAAAQSPQSNPTQEAAPQERFPQATPLQATPRQAASPEPIEVTVAGTRVARTAGSAHVISKRQLERFAYDDPSALLMQVPGVYLRQEDGIGLRPNIGIRGANPDRSKKVTLMEDGILFGPAPYSAPAAYYFPLMALMTNVRVIKGPSAVAYGPQTVGGAIDFVTRPIPTETAGLLDLGFGEYGFNKQHASFGSSDGRVGFLVEGARLQNKGFKHLPNGADTGSTRNDWMSKFSFVLDPTATGRNEFGLKLAYADEVSNETYLGLSDADFRKDPLQRYAGSALDQMKNHRTAVVLSHQVELLSANLSLTTKMYRHDYARIWRKVNRFRGSDIWRVLQQPDSPENAGLYTVLTGREDSGTGGDTVMVGPNNRTFVSQGIQSTLDLRPKTGPLSHRIEAGVRLHNDEITRRHSENGFLMVGGQLVTDGTAEVVTVANTESTYAVALHAVDAVTWRNLTVTPGIRVELISSTSEDQMDDTGRDRFVMAWMPGIGAFYALTDVFGLLGGAYRGFSPPPPGSDDHIRPEYSVNYEGGGRFSSGRARAEVIGFYNDYSNLTDICTLSSGCLTEDLDRQFDAGEARIFGFEAYAGQEFPLGGSIRLPLTLAYTLTRAEFLNDFSSQDPIYGSVEQGDKIPYVPRHQLGVTAGIEGKLAGGVAGLNYVSPMREEAGSEALKESLHTDEQFWLDLGVTIRPVPPLTLYSNVRNVLDTHNLVSRRPYGARPNAPRWIQAGAKLEF